MTLRPPPLERRSYDDLIAEARRRIARYAPEWTDHNESDPGIALVEMFAWLAQITQEKVNTLGDRAYRELLALAGLDVKPARSAEADLVFTAVAGAIGPAAVPEHTQVGGGSTPDGAPIIFQTADDLGLVPYPLAALLTWDGTVFDDRLKRNEPGDPTFQPFGPAPQRDSALYFGFTPAPSRPQAAGAFPTRIALRLFEPDESIEGAVVRCGAPAAPSSRALVFEFLPEEGGTWTELEILSDTTRNGERGGYMAIGGPRTEILPARVGPVPDPLYWLRLRLVAPDYPRPPVLEFLRFNTVPARNEVTVLNELLEPSDGSADQTRQVQLRPVVAETVSVDVEDESKLFVAWSKVDYFVAPTAGDPPGQNYVLDPATGSITFGDGRFADIPPAGSRLRASYESAGGAAGNVAPDTITALFNSLPRVQGVTNPRRAIGGADTQSVSDALRTAPAEFGRRRRVVTPEDYKAAAKEVGGVARAHVVAAAHPDYPGVEVPGSVTVLIVQDTDRRLPAPQEELLRAVCRRLDGERLLTTELHVTGPEFVEISVEAEIQVDPGASPELARNAAVERLDRALATDKWPFGQDLHPASLFHSLLDNDEDDVSTRIRAVRNLRIRRDGNRLPGDTLDPTEKVPLSAVSLVYPGKHELEISIYEEEPR